MSYKREIFDQLKEQYEDDVKSRKYTKNGRTYYAAHTIEDVVNLLQTQNMILGAIADDLAILIERNK
jgi:hypothetical protein